MKSIKSICASICLVLPFAVLGSPFTNGSFELPGFGSSNFKVFLPGDTSLVGWTIGGSGPGVRYAYAAGDFYTTVVDGSILHVTFYGRDQTTYISQTFDTLAGRDYAVTFFVGGFDNGDPVTGEARLEATVTSDTRVMLATLTVAPPAQLYGGQQRFLFNAASAQTTLTFSNKSTITRSWAVALDAVAVSLLPPPIQPPTILSQPASSTNVVGDSMTFGMNVGGTQPLRYQWLFNGKNLSGATNSTLTLASIKQNDAGSYSVIIVNDAGVSLSKEARLVVLQQVPPVITVQPESLAVAQSESAILRVVATATPAPTFQWFHGDQSISGATNDTYSIVSVQPEDKGPYSVLISNPAGVLRSATASLTLRPQLKGMKLSVLHGFQYAIDGESGQTYAIEVSQDLQRWTSLIEVTNTSAVSVFLEPNALLAPFQLAPYRFYRAKVK